MNGDGAPGPRRTGRSAPAPIKPRNHPPAAHASSPAQRRLAIGVLLGGAFCVGVGNTVVFAVLPPLARRIGLHDLQVLSVFMVSAVFWVSLAPVWGRLSDRRGRRPFILMGYATFAVSMTLFATTVLAGARGAIVGAPLYVLLILSRSVWGMLGSATAAVGQAYIADRTPPERRAAGLASFAAAFGLGAMMGPAFAGALADLNPAAPLYGVAIAAAAATGGIFAFLKENTPPKERTPTPRLSPLDRRVRGYLIYGLATALVTALQTQFISFFVIDRIVDAGADDPAILETAGVALSTSAAAALFAQLALVRGFNLQPRLLMRVGPVLLCVGHAVVAAANGLGPLAFGMLIAGLGAGLSAPGFVGGASLAVSAREQGAISGLANAATAASFIIGPPLGYALYAAGPQILFTATAVVAAGAAVFAFVSRDITAAHRAAEATNNDTTNNDATNTGAADNGAADNGAADNVAAKTGAANTSAAPLERPGAD